MTNPILERLKEYVLPRIILGKDPPSPQAEVYLRDVLGNPDIPVTTRGERLGYSAHMISKVKNELLERKFVRLYEINLNRINKFLEITEEGYQYLGERPKQKGKGSPEHRYWQRNISSHFQNSLGLNAKIEGNREGKLVDVAVTDEDGKMMAVEIALTPKNEMSNIKKDLDAGFNKVLIACQNKKVKEEVERKIEANLNEDERSKVKTCLLTDFI